MVDPRKKPSGDGYMRDQSQDNVKALARLLIRSNQQPVKSVGKEKKIELNKEAVDRKVNQIGSAQMDADALMQVLPDIELCKQVLIGVILSPKDMYSTEVGFTADADLFDGEIIRGFLELIEKYVVRKYNLNDRLEKILESALFKDGSYPIVILPENNLDRIINHEYNPGMEHYATQLYRRSTATGYGLLGRSDTVSNESHGNKPALFEEKIFPNITVTDNFNVLKHTSLDRKIRQSKLESMFSNEAFTGMSDDEIERLYSKPVNVADQNSAVVLDATVGGQKGCPLTISLPASSVIPVATPGRPEEHVGYFVVLNEKGMPVDSNVNRNYHDEFRARYNAGASDENSDIMQQVKAAMGMGADKKIDGLTDQHLETFGPIITGQLEHLLRNGMYDEELSFELTQNIKRLMLTRALGNRRTQLLFVPKELMVYIAFDYDDEGVGVSLLRKTSIIGSMRMALALAHNMGQLKNAVPRRKVTVELDEDDQDPSNTIAQVQNLLLQQSIKSYPLAANSPADMQTALQLSAVDMAFTGEAPGLPKTKVEFEDWISQDQGGNPEYAEELRKQHIMGLKLNPEMVDPSQSPDYAVEVVNNNLMMSKTIRHLQKIITRHLTDFVRKFCRYSGDFKRECMAVIEERRRAIDDEVYGQHSVAEYIDAFLETVEVTLPSPDRSRVEQQATAFEQYSQLLDACLSAYMSADLIPPEMMGSDAKGTIEQAVAVVKANYLRDWMAENNVMPELQALLELDEDEKPTYSLFDTQEPIFKSIVASIKKYMDAVMPEDAGGFNDNGNMGGGDDMPGDSSGEGDGMDEFGDDFGESPEGDGTGEGEESEDLDETDEGSDEDGISEEDETQADDTSAEDEDNAEVE